MLYLHSLGHFHPENVIDNQFLESLDIGTDDEWILERVGIRQRRTVLPLDFIRSSRNADLAAAQEAALYSNVETARRAALMALERAKLGPSDIGMVVAGGCAPEMQIPSEAARVANALGIEAPAFDVNSACSSFGAQLHLLAQMTALPRFVLVVNPENTTRVVDYRDRANAVLWGDGTSAAIVSTQVRARLAVTRTLLESSPAGCALVTVPRFGHFAQEGSQVQRFAIKTTLACLERLLPGARARVARTGGRVRFVGHQANGMMLDSVAKRAGVDAADHFRNVEDFGNTGAAGAPSVLSQRWGELGAGDSVVLVVVGSGLTWAALELEVAAS
ncbi:MAG: ketoacyl-ACP synthase III [Myxococcales bacterium]|nr:ketoacyl-ACP synthase III [Myxococcales bacterium]